MNSMASITMLTWWLPGPPAHDLVIGQAALNLGVLESPLNPVALALHLGQAFQRCVAGALDRLYLILFGAPASRRRIICQPRAVVSSPPHTQHRRCAISTRNG